MMKDADLSALRVGTGLVRQMFELLDELLRPDVGDWKALEVYVHEILQDVELRAVPKMLLLVREHDSS
jgi:hypothetical protein